MILPDVNVLISAFHQGAPDHDTYARWLNASLAGAEDLLLPDAVVAGFLRIVTDRRIYDRPAPMRTAWAFVSAVTTHPRSHTVDDSGSIWRQFGLLTARDLQITGRLVPDAYLAAVAISHKARIATRDRGYGRFPGLRWFDPAAEG